MALAVAALNCLGSLFAVSSAAAGFFAILSLSGLILALAHRRSVIFHAGRAFHRVMTTIMTTAVPPDPKKEELTFPNKDGSTFTAPIMSFKVSQLKELCRSLGQTCSGTKLVLQERLKAYSQDTEQWNLMKPGARRSHKGSRSHENHSDSNEKKPKKRSVYAKRRDELFGTAETALSAVQRSKDMRTPQEKQAVLDWAAEMAQEFTDFQTPRAIESVEPLFPTPAARDKKIEEKLDTILTLCATGGSTRSRSFLSSPTPFSTFSEVGDSMALCHRTSGMIPSPAVPPTHPVPAVNNQLQLPVPGALPVSTKAHLPLHPVPHSMSMSTQVPLPPPSTSSFSTPTASALVPAPSVTASSPLKVIILANGTRLEFFPSQVPDPIFISFADDIAKLARMWDDADPGYNTDECLLRINGYGIPLRLWEKAYKYGGDLRWKGTKDKWSKWKFVVEAYKNLGEAAFWAKYHDPKTNSRMSFTAIATELRNERKAHDAQVATDVRSELGHEFGDKFGYRGKVLVRPSAIAKRSRALQLQN